MMGFVDGQQAPIECFVLTILFTEYDGSVCFGQFVAQVKGMCDVEVLRLGGKQLLEQALDYTDGNVSEVARLLGLTRGALRHRLEKRGLGSSGS